MSDQRSRRRGVRLVAVVAALAIGALSLGYALGSSTILSGTETGVGNSENAAILGWFVVSQVLVASVPAVVPPQASESMGLPTVLLAVNQTFVVVAATPGHGAVRWDFTEKGAPTKTEITLTFLVTNATTRATATSTIFLESQATVISGTPDYTFYFDNGAGTATLTGDSDVSQQCPTVGNCP